MNWTPDRAREYPRAFLKTPFEAGLELAVVCMRELGLSGQAAQNFEVSVRSPDWAVADTPDQAIALADQRLSTALILQDDPSEELKEYNILTIEGVKADAAELSEACWAAGIINPDPNMTHGVMAATQVACNAVVDFPGAIWLERRYPEVTDLVERDVFYGQLPAGESQDAIDINHHPSERAATRRVAHKNLERSQLLEYAHERFMGGFTFECIERLLVQNGFDLNVVEAVCGAIVKRQQRAPVKDFIDLAQGAPMETQVMAERVRTYSKSFNRIVAARNNRSDKR